MPLAIGAVSVGDGYGEEEAALPGLSFLGIVVWIEVLAWGVSVSAA